MGKTLPIGAGQPHHLQQRLNAAGALGRLCQAEQCEWPLECLANRQPRIERRSNVLEDDLRLSAKRTQRFGRKVGYVGAVELDAAIALPQQLQ
jgi:hypothetical protein